MNSMAGWPSTSLGSETPAEYSQVVDVSSRIDPLMISMAVLMWRNRLIVEPLQYQKPEIHDVSVDQPMR